MIQGHNDHHQAPGKINGVNTFHFYFPGHRPACVQSKYKRIFYVNFNPAARNAKPFRIQDWEDQ